MIGSWGNVALDFYIANSLWINGFFLLYALIVVLARRNFDNGNLLLINSIQKQYGEKLSGKSTASILSILKKISIPWNEAITKTALPLIAPPGSIWVYPQSIKNFQKFIKIENLVELLHQQLNPKQG